MAGKYRFSFGPWNIHEGADPFGPSVRSGITFAKKLKMYKKLGFDGVQCHDDDAVPDMNKLRPKDIAKAAKEVHKALKDEGLTAEFVAPRLWEDRRTIDGLDVKAMRSRKQGVATKHLTNSRTIRGRLVELVRGLDQTKVDQLIAERDYKELDMLIVNHLMGK